MLFNIFWFVVSKLLLPKEFLYRRIRLTLIIFISQNIADAVLHVCSLRVVVSTEVWCRAKVLASTEWPDLHLLTIVTSTFAPWLLCPQWAGV